MVSTRSMVLSAAQEKAAATIEAEHFSQKTGLEEATSEQDADAQQINEPSPAEKVFATVELAEMILSLLPLEDTLSMHRVCRASHDVIETSKAVQKYLCIMRKDEQALIRSPIFKPAFTIAFHFPSTNARKDRYFHLTSFHAPSTKATFDLNFSLLNPPRNVRQIQATVITIGEDSKAQELWRKIRWVEAGVKRGGAVWLEKKTASAEFVWISRALSRAATLGRTWELLLEMADDELFR
ncbi:hypothetical protein M409DRAFT_54575 [Zasmidium cellare ATCC 36951]|uniref:F-box domain-containing protein n=1 Tax=Zasmidium cellare ATCC 36951 TaxID=1080233 RepID=A0A6A6CID3_ZASCE|nr:uncharacterized protein M409DRAFT_54575 [Zasmidium cellare ATCC 36951]KAF2166791.1 hypothetical protein M409DRAFT_54575 [Zasmidium cellare ATCC 36951]